MRLRAGIGRRCGSLKPKIGTTIESFVCRATRSKVVFGAGAQARLPEEAEALGVSRGLVLSTPGQRHVAESIATLLGDRCAGVCAEAVMHTPVEVTDRARRMVDRSGADGLIAIGGGSAVGLSKALAFHTGLAQIILPTTYAGSEMTSILGQTDRGQKTTIRSPKVLPEVVIYDVALTLSLPAAMSASSGFNALAHLAEALYAHDANPVVSLLAKEGIRRIARALPRIVVDPRDSDARSEAQYAAFLGGVCLESVGMGLHHKLCHVLGGSLDLPHAETHAILLPHVLSYNSRAAGGAMATMASALGETDVPGCLWRLSRSLGVPRSLSVIGMPRDGIPHVVDMVLAHDFRNPRELERRELLHLLERAWEGEATDRAPDTAVLAGVLDS